VASLAPAPGPNANVRFIVAPRAGRSKLRVGVFADSAQQPRWIVEALAKVAASDFAELTVVAVGTPNRGQTTCPDSRNAVLANGTSGLSPVWRAYCKVDRMMFGSGPDWSQKQDLDVLVPRARRLDSSDGEAAAWRKRILELGLDVAFALGEVDDTSLEGMARCGVWRYCFGEDEHTREPLAGVREVIDGAAVMASGIRIHRGAGFPDRLAYQSWSRTFPFSFTRSREGLLPKTAEFIARTLRDLHSSGPAWLEQSTVPARDVPEPGFPGSVSLIRDLSRVGLRVARRTAEKYLTVGQWQLAFRFDRTSGPGCRRDDGTSRDEEPRPDDGLASLEGYLRLQPPKDRFWADPFPVSRNGRHWIFFEELPFAAGRAHISAIEVRADGSTSEPVRVLERDYHLSYPFLIEDEGQLYMIPETAHNHTVEIYRCVDFPRRWKLERVMMKDLWCADATIHRAHDRYWMFASLGFDGGEVNDELHLFSSERLLGDWKPHRRNPVKSDVRNARPAGRLFTHGGHLYRPGQVCAPIYGSGIAINRVTRLCDTEYAEEEVRRIVPAGDGGILGIHTINRAGALSVTDAFVRRSRFGA
jgi:hypothetical protein